MFTVLVSDISGASTVIMYAAAVRVGRNRRVARPGPARSRC